MPTQRRRTTPRVVIDTNIVLSALVFRGDLPLRARHAWQSGLCIPLVSTVTAQELVRVLAYPRFRLTPVEQEDLLSDYLPYTEVVSMPRTLPQVPQCRDPHDMPFLQLALAGKAQALITGDQDLLSLPPWPACPVMPLAQWLAQQT